MVSTLISFESYHQFSTSIPSCILLLFHFSKMNNYYQHLTYILNYLCYQWYKFIVLFLTYINTYICHTNLFHQMIQTQGINIFKYSSEDKRKLDLDNNLSKLIPIDDIQWNTYYLPQIRVNQIEGRPSLHLFRNFLVQSCFSLKIQNIFSKILSSVPG